MVEPLSVTNTMVGPKKVQYPYPPWLHAFYDRCTGAFCDRCTDAFCDRCTDAFCDY